MSTPGELFRINLNQNIWALIVALGSLGTAEYLDLRALFWISLLLAAVVSLSVAVTVFSYTVAYVRKKWAV